MFDRETLIRRSEVNASIELQMMIDLNHCARAPVLNIFISSDEVAAPNQEIHYCI